MELRMLVLIQLSVMDSDLPPNFVARETCKAWEQTLPIKTETKTVLVSAYILITRLLDPLIKGQPFPRSSFCCHTSLVGFLVFVFFSVHSPFSFSSSSALVFLIPPLHSLQHSSLIACPWSHLLYTFLCFSCQKEVMGLWMGRIDQ